MGFLSKFFGSGPQYPEFDARNPAQPRLAQVQKGLQELAQKTEDRLEVVPADGTAFVFVGKPPKQFGLVWFEGNEAKNLKHFIAERQIDSKGTARLVEALTQAYERSQSEQRYLAKVAGRDFVVTPSERLATEVGKILERGAGA